MKLTTAIFRIALTLGVAALGAAAVPWAFGDPAAMAGADGGGGTPLPDGWELCVLQGVAGPATQNNVADLDEWQTAEGGSTNNSAAYNPFNTSRTTDVNNAALPETSSSNGFPAFSDWISGCAATVATIMQPNMTSILAALRAGNVAPPQAFLAVVDQSQWCAPSADGTPCYASMILGSTGSLAASVLKQSSALDVYSSVQSDLRSYQLAVASVSSAQSGVTTTNVQLGAAQSALSAAQSHATSAEKALRHFAISEYIDSGLYQGSFVANGSTNTPFGTPSPQGVIAHQYASVIAANLLSQSQAAAAAAKASLAHRNATQKDLQVAEATLVSDNNAENHSLVKLVADVTTLEKAGACTNANIVVASTPAPANGSPTTPSSGSSPTTTTTTTSTVPSSTTTSSSTTTTTTTPILNLDKTTTTTAPPTTTSTSTTTTSTPAPTTTTTTAPTGSGSGNAAAPAPTANPAGLDVLQGCVNALAPVSTT
ncbi:MAG TPA: hypothetical protein VIY26_08520 [Acidimicrobiales bacterium]